jgi:hypothetical protein
MAADAIAVHALIRGYGMMTGETQPGTTLTGRRRVTMGLALISMLALFVGACGGEDRSNSANSRSGASRATVAPLPIRDGAPMVDASERDEAELSSVATPTSVEAADQELADETPTPEITVTPTAEADASPGSDVPPPAPTLSVQFGMVAGAPPGQTASVMVQTAPNTPCTLSFVGPDGAESEADGLGPATTDAQGRAYWYWKIDPASPLGTGTATATCNDTSVSVPIRIGGVG